MLQVTAEAVNGRVLSTYPANVSCARRVVDNGATYCYLQGTSMAGPHVAGVAALIISHTGKSGGAVQAALQQATNAAAVPGHVSIYAAVPTESAASRRTCTGGIGHNSFYGAGEIDALKAVS